MEQLRDASIEYIHQVPGRLRLRVPEVRRNPTAAASLEQLLRRTPGIRSVEARALTGSVVIAYDRTRTNANAVVRILDNHRSGLQSAHAPHVAMPSPLATQALVRRRPNHIASRPALEMRRREGSSTLGSELAMWLLKKALEIALERSLVLLIAAIL